MPNSLLHPDQAGTNLEKLVEQSRDVLRAAEDVDDINGPGQGGGGPQIRVHRLAQRDSGGRMNRDNLVTHLLQVGRHSMAGTLGLSTQPDHRDPMGITEKLGESGAVRRHLRQRRDVEDVR
jgi:hypothetical protein